MKKRFKLSSRRSKRMFRKSAKRVHRKNLQSSGNVMRGGIRM